MLPIKKIYVDSRHRTADSESSSNFKIDLPYSITLPENTVFCNRYMYSSCISFD